VIFGRAGRRDREYKSAFFYNRIRGKRSATKVKAIDGQDTFHSRMERERERRRQTDQ
jgi:hypothetical protein